MKLKHFYKVENNKLIKGSGYKIPEGFIEYDKNNPPKDFLDLQNKELFEETKSNKILQLKQDFETLRNKTAHILSKTINKEINARQQDLVNIDSLISILPDDTTTIEFRCYDNSFVKVNKEQLLNIKKEIIQEGIDTYKRKWTLEQKIKSATSIDELNSIKWDEKLNEMDNT